MAEDEKKLAKRAFRLSKNIYASANDELEVANTYYNFANQLRNFGEKEEALSILEVVKSIDSKYNDESLIQAANLLSERIGTDNIPDILSN
jgi:tetratricopeptide (TPR) repeat protein